MYSERIGTSFSETRDTINLFQINFSNLVYLQKHERPTDKKANCSVLKVSKRFLLFQNELHFITELLKSRDFIISLRD